MHTYDDLPQPKTYHIPMVGSDSQKYYDRITLIDYEDDLISLRTIRVQIKNLFVQYHCNNELTEWEYEVELGILHQQCKYLEHRLALYYTQQAHEAHMVKAAQELDVFLEAIQGKVTVIPHILRKKI